MKIMWVGSLLGCIIIFKDSHIFVVTIYLVIYDLQIMNSRYTNYNVIVTNERQIKQENEHC